MPEYSKFKERKPEDTVFEIQKILKQLRLMTKQARSLMILGGSRTAYYLARRLSLRDGS